MSRLCSILPAICAGLRSAERYLRAFTNLPLTRCSQIALVVSSAARRSGIGRQLIAEAERWAQSIGVETIVVRSNTKRTEAHDFYPAMGYKLIKTQTVYRKRMRSYAAHHRSSRCETVIVYHQF